MGVSWLAATLHGARPLLLRAVNVPPFTPGLRMRASPLVAVCVVSVVFASTQAWAVPSFARQTGLSCSGCHTVFPELTPLGRQFKAGGYTMSSTPQVSEGGQDEHRATLEMPANAPLGVMALVGFTHTARAQQVGPEGAEAARNDDLSLPQQFSIFYAGKVAPKLGAFIQLTYSGPEGTIGFDNTDLRFAHQFELAGQPMIFGATLNNSPTVTDLWNSTPAWGVPWASSGSAPSPSTSTMIEGRLAQSVAGAGLYGFWGNMLYAELNAYRSAPLGVSLPLDATTGATNVIQSVMPYWRVAFEKGFGNNSLSVGTFGLHGVFSPGGTFIDDSSGEPVTMTHPLSGPGDAYTDLAVDSQFQHIGEHHIVTGVVTYIHEGQVLAATHAFGNADNATNELHSFKASGSYIYDRLVGARVTFRTLRGSSDATLYGDQGPRSTSLSAEVFTTPWQNAKLGLQYVAHLDFNGAALNYDGAGRDAAHNDTLYAYVWLAF